MTVNPDYAHNESLSLWAKADEDEVHNALRSTILRFDEMMPERLMQNNYHLALYEGRAECAEGLPVNLRLNVCHAVVDTALSELGANRPRPMFLTEEGNRDMQTRAKKLNQFVDGQFYQSQQYDLSQEVFRDGCLFDIACENIDIKPGVPGDEEDEEGEKPRIVTRRVDPNHLVFSPYESHTGVIHQIHEIQPLPRWELAERFPGHEDIIASSRRIRDLDYWYHEHIFAEDDLVDFGTSYYVGGLGATKGRKVQWVANGVISDDPWEEGYFPYEFFRWTELPRSFLGQGLLRQVSTIQEQIDFLSWKIKEHMDLASSQVWIKSGSMVPKERISSRVWGHNEYATDPPIYMNIPPVAKEYFEEREALRALAFSLPGISEFAATAQKPAGLNSGRAIRAYNDMKSARHLPRGQRWENFHLGVADKMIRLAKRLDEMGEGSYRVMAKSKKGLVYIKWSEVNMERDEYMLQAFPVSFLSKTPSSRMDDVYDLLQMFPQLQPFAAELMDIPDVAGALGLANAPLEEIMACIDSILEKGKYLAPDPQSKVDMAIPIALLFYQREKAESDGSEEAEARQEMLRDYILACRDIQNQGTPPPPGAPGQGAPSGEGGAPQAPPMEGAMPAAPPQAA